MIMTGITITSKPGYLIAATVFLILTVITLREFLLGDSLFEYRDLVWPPTIDLFFDSSSTIDLESARRIIFLAPLFSLVDSLGLSTLFAEKLFFVLTRFFAGFLTYLATYKFLKSRLTEPDASTNANAIFLVALLSGFFYSYNPVATTMVSSTLFFAFSYSLIPLTFYFFDRTLTSKSFFNLFITSLLITLVIAGVTQFLVLVPLFILLPWFVIVCVKRRRMNPGVLLATKNFALVALFTFLLSFYWILASVAVATNGVALHPGYLVTYDGLVTFSERTSVVDVIRLMGDWWPRVNLQPAIIDNSIWTILTFVIPITMVLFILFSRDSQQRFYLISFSLLALVIIFFNKGLQPPIPEFYPILYSIPTVGWMFRIPSKFAMVLAFYVTMIITIGFYSLFAPKAKTNSNSNNFTKNVKYACASIFIVCISLIVWPMFTGDLGGVYQKGITQSSIQQEYPPSPAVNTPDVNILLFGSPNKLLLLNDSGVINLDRTAAVIADQSLGGQLKGAILSSTLDKMIVQDRATAMMQLLNNHEDLILKPFDATNRDNPTKVWSASAASTSFSPFRSFLIKQYSIDNFDLDLGKGLVFTTASDKLEIPLEVKNPDQYDLYIRYLKNEYGGIMKVHLDNEELVLNSRDELSAFEWSNLGSFALSSSKHVLTLENIYGLNAVNILVLVPSESIPSLLGNVYSIADGKRNIFLLDPETDLYSMGKVVGEQHLFNRTRATFQQTFVGELEVPEQATQFILELLSDHAAEMSSSYKISRFEIYPVFSDYLYKSNFENGTGWHNDYGSYQTLSYEPNEQKAGRKNLTVNIMNISSNFWYIVKSDSIPMEENMNLSYVIKASGSNVTAFHSKVVYHDQSNNIIGANNINSGINGIFEDTLANSFRTPNGTSSIQFQFLAKGNQGYSTYSIDDLTVQEIQPNGNKTLNDVKIFDPASGNPAATSEYNGTSLQVKVDQHPNIASRNMSESVSLRTRAIDTAPNSLYQFVITIEGDEIIDIESRAVYLRGYEKTTSTHLGEDLLDINANSELSRNIDILKSSKYSVAIRARTCENCSSVIVEIGNRQYKRTLDSNTTDIKWLYFTTDLIAGKTEMKIYSDGEASLGPIILYSDSHSNESPIDLFSNGRHSAVTAYHKIDSTKYEATINTTVPFVLEFTETYNPLWETNISGQKYQPVPLFQTINSTTNGFIIDKTGQFDLIIEYIPQTWFYVGMGISGATFVGSLAFLIWRSRFFKAKESLLTILASDIRLGQPWAKHKNKSGIMKTPTHEVLPTEANIGKVQVKQQPRHGKKMLFNVLADMVRIDSPTLPIFIALFLITSTPLFLLLDIPNVDSIMIYAYSLLFFGVAWHLIRQLR